MGKFMAKETHKKKRTLLACDIEDDVRAARLFVTYIMADFNDDSMKIPFDFD